MKSLDLEHRLSKCIFVFLACKKPC